MTFTDDDLKRLKEGISKGSIPICDNGFLLALLARLEAAEHFIDKTTDTYPHTKDSDVYRVWRKASGKAGDSADGGAGK